MDTLYLALDVLLETAGELMQERDLGLRQLWEETLGTGRSIRWMPPGSLTAAEAY